MVSQQTLPIKLENLAPLVATSHLLSSMPWEIILRKTLNLMLFSGLVTFLPMTSGTTQKSISKDTKISQLTIWLPTLLNSQFMFQKETTTLLCQTLKISASLMKSFNLTCKFGINTSQQKLNKSIRTMVIIQLSSRQVMEESTKR